MTLLQIKTTYASVVAYKPGVRLDGSENLDTQDATLAALASLGAILDRVRLADAEESDQILRALIDSLAEVSTHAHQ